MTQPNEKQRPPSIAATSPMIHTDSGFNPLACACGHPQLTGRHHMPFASGVDCCDQTPTIVGSDRIDVGRQGVLESTADQNVPPPNLPPRRRADQQTQWRSSGKFDKMSTHYLTSQFIDALYQEELMMVKATESNVTMVGECCDSHEVNDVKSRNECRLGGKISRYVLYILTNFQLQAVY